MLTLADWQCGGARILSAMPQFVVVIGGSGSGKNYYVEHHPVYSRYTLIDVDPPAGAGGDQRDQLAKRIAGMKNELTRALGEGVDIVHPTPGAGLSALRNKLNLARKFGYETVLILIDTDPRIAAGNIRQRVSGGGHGAGIPDWKVEKTNAEARANYAALSGDPTLVSDSFVVSGRKVLESMLRAYIRLLRD